jgi:hypothetical protein
MSGLPPEAAEKRKSPDFAFGPMLLKKSLVLIGES